jgi:hypothetical protein
MAPNVRRLLMSTSPGNLQERSKVTAAHVIKFLWVRKGFPLRILNFDTRWKQFVSFMLSRLKLVEGILQYIVL